MELNGFNLGILASQGSFDGASANSKAGVFVAGLIERRVDLGDFDHRGLLRGKKEAVRYPRRPECVFDYRLRGYRLLAARIPEIQAHARLKPPQSASMSSASPQT